MLEPTVTGLWASGYQSFPQSPELFPAQPRRNSGKWGAVRVPSLLSCGSTEVLLRVITREKISGDGEVSCFNLGKTGHS